MSDSLAPRPDHSALARLREHLYAHGPCSVLEAARACGLRPSEVTRQLREGGIVAAARPSGTSRRCVICRGVAVVSDLCADCHDGFRAGRREPGARGMRSRRAG